MRQEICEIIGIREPHEACPDNGKSAQKWSRRLTVQEWQISEELLKILVPLNVANKEFQSNTSPTISLVMPYIEKIRRHCTNIHKDLSISSVIRQVANVISVEVGRRFSVVFTNPIYAIATLVDPLTKKFFKPYIPFAVRDDVEKFVLSKIKESNEGLEANSSVPALHSFLDDTDSETPIFNLDRYLSEQVSPDEVPSFLARQPKALQELYISICGIPAASSEVERLFSTCGQINSKLRCSMSSQNLEDRSLLKKNALSLAAFSENRYPESTPKLANWLSSIPQLEQTFFAKDDSDKSDDKKSDEDGENDEWDEMKKSIGSESEGEEELIVPEELQSGEWWVGSNASKNFNKGVRDLGTQKGEEEGSRGTKRKRGDEETRPVKRRKMESLTKPPRLGSRVWVHFTKDCDCGKPIVECDCEQWYDGTVLEELPKRDNGDRVFYVDFDCGDEDFIKWKADAPNDFWAKWD